MSSSSLATIYEFENYKDYVNHYVESLPKNGWGFFGQMAQHLRVNSTMISQIFKGPKNLSLEQAHELSEFLGLNELQTEYFLLLVQLERAGSKKLSDYFQKQLALKREEGLEVVSRIPNAVELSESEMAIFYSDYRYSAIRMLASCPDFNTMNDLASKLGGEPRALAAILDFLLAHGLCVQSSKGLDIGATRTHLKAGSPLIARHHGNWRLFAMEKHKSLDSSELAFTAPLSLSAADFERCKKLILDFIEELGPIVADSPAEHAAVLNIDWLKI